MTTAIVITLSGILVYALISPIIDWYMKGKKEMEEQNNDD